MNTNTLTVLPRTAHKAEFVIVLDAYEPASANLHLPEPTFIDPIAGTANWILPTGGIEVPVERWLSGDLARKAFTAGHSSTHREPLPSWLHAEPFYAERSYMDPAWELVGALMGEEV
jgi:hypothetical protein